jgi:hypothetical protein
MLRGDDKGGTMKILDFVSEMKEKATKELVAVSGGGSCVKRTHTFQIGHAEIITIRGGGIEKAAITLLTLKGIKSVSREP